MNEFQNRLNLVLERIDDQKFLNNDGIGNEIGFWIFDYPAKFELIVREHIAKITDKLTRRGRKFIHLNLFGVLIAMLESRGIYDSACTIEIESGIDELRKCLAGPLNQEKIAKFIAVNHNPAELELVILSGLGSAWPLIRGHELLSSLHQVMDRTPLVLFYPGEYSGNDLYPFGRVESSSYYRAFKLVPESGTQS